MVVVKYYRSPDDENSDEKKQEKSALSSEALVDEKQPDPSSSTEKEASKSFLIEDKFQGWDKLVSFLIMNRSSLSIGEVFKNVVILCFVFGFGMLSRDRVQNSSLNSFKKITQITSERDVSDFSLPFKRTKRSLNVNDIKDVAESQAVENKYYATMSPEDKKLACDCLHKLFTEYVHTISPGSRFSINYRTYLGFQVVYNKGTTNLSMPEQFDEMVARSRNGEGIDSDGSVLPVLSGVVQQLVNNWPYVKKNFQLKPVLILGFSLDYRIK